ncbi:hypothetical protein K1719_018402 [Acacia pycnantha]|nr:hypothetical protein K1719_018402 [Acacia pycnantha]
MVSLPPPISPTLEKTLCQWIPLVFPKESYCSSVSPLQDSGKIYVFTTMGEGDKRADFESGSATKVTKPKRYRSESKGFNLLQIILENTVDDVEAKNNSRGGSDTSVVLLTWTLFQLSLHPQCQDRLRAE